VRELETDYLVIGGGASGMAFADTLVAHSDAEVVIVDRRHGPGGHWHDAYPFVRLHQPSAYYGVESRPLGNDHIDEHGPNAGFYERASSAEICDYYAHVLDEELLPTGRVRFLGLGDYRGEERVVSLLDGTETRVKARRKVVDATHVQPEIPSRHTPGFTVEAGVALVPPNALVDVAEPPDRFTVIGAGKTAIDTCVWLLDEGVDPDRIRWIRGRDPWQFNRTFTQPLTLVGSYMQLQARWVEAAAAATDGHDFAHRLEAAGIFLRLDPAVQPQAFRGATVSAREIDGARRIDDVVRARRVHRIGRTSLSTDAGEIVASPRDLYVDCTAAGVPPAAARQVFDGGRITIQFVAVGFLPWSAATIGFVESTHLSEEEKNRLCPPVVFSGDVTDLPELAYAAMRGQVARARHELIGPWNAATRLNPAGALLEHIDEPDVADSLTAVIEHTREALENLQRVAAASEAATA
jgi:cation diffusion facilitator CzcD-associated flavoprotein CzcO